MNAVRFQDIPLVQKISISTDSLNPSINRSGPLANKSENTSNEETTNNDDTYTRSKRGLGDLIRRKFWDKNSQQSNWQQSWDKAGQIEEVPLKGVFNK